jgi:hypothetical protein
MVDRPILYSEEQGRTFDILWGLRDALIALCQLEQDLSGTIGAQLAGFGATPTSPATLTINLAAGSIYQQSAVDSTSYGALASDTQIIQQQGLAATQQVALTTSGLAGGQSRWALVQAQFAQVDQVATGDPTGGLLLYYNSTNPSQPFQGPNNDGQIQPTVRLGTVAIQVLYGSVATTGSEVPPTPTTGWVPMYLVDLTFGQTQITSGQILVAGPSVGSNVPSNYPGAPFIAGLLNQHHKGIAGQAPQIDLTAEVKNQLPLTNMPASNTTGGISAIRQNAGNPNGNVAGNANVNGAPDQCWDTTNKLLYICTTTGTTSTAVWTSVVGASTSQFAGGTSTGAANAQVVATTTPAGFAKTPGQIVTFTVGPGPNTGATTLNVDGTGVSAINKTGPVPLTGGELTVGEFVSVIWTGTVYLIQSAQLGQLATMNIGAFLKNDGAGNLTTNNGLTLGTDGTGALTVQPATITPQMLSVAGAPFPYCSIQPVDNLRIQNDATNPTYAFNVTTGSVRDDQNLTNLQMILAGMTKRLDQSWAGGTNNGACDASTKGPNQTWHIYLIGKTGMVPTAVSRASNVASMTIANHGLGVGSQFRTQGFGGGFDGFQIATAVTTNSITWSNAGGNVSSGAPATTALVDGFDILASQSYPTPTLPASFTTKQCLGSFLTDGSANILSMLQIGDEFILAAAANNNVTVGTSRISQVLTGVPNGVAVTAHFQAAINSPGGFAGILFTSLYQNDVAVTNVGSPGDLIQTTANGAAAGDFSRVTNTAAQIGVRASAAGIPISIYTQGWRDPRRRLF